MSIWHLLIRMYLESTMKKISINFAHFHFKEKNTIAKINNKVTKDDNYMVDYNIIRRIIQFFFCLKKIQQRIHVSI